MRAGRMRLPQRILRDRLVIARRGWLTGAGVLAAVVASGVLAFQVPSALDRGPRSEDLVSLEREMADVRDERVMLQARAEELLAEAEGLHRQAETLEARSERKARQLGDLREGVRDLQARVEELGG